MTCQTCASEFHLECVKITKEEFKFIRESKKPWYCQTCVRARRASLNDDSPIPARSSSTDSGKAKVQRDNPEPTMQKMMDAINSLREEVKVSNDAYIRKLDAHTKEIKDISAHLNQYSDLIQQNTEAINGLRTELMLLNNGVQDLRDRNKALERKVSTLQSIVEDMDQSALTNAVEISGIPVDQQKSVIELVELVGRAVNFEINKRMINNCFRRQGPVTASNPGLMFVSFISKLDKDAFMSAARRTANLTSRQLGFIDGEEIRIYINHSMTYAKRKLLNMVKTYKRENNYKFVWTRNGKIFIRKSETSSIIEIRTAEDIAEKLSKNDQQQQG
ncbi:hypothetical protein GE061_008885 [Apolygus lucorum]|uniref:FP protein C-terminal domain-containing protein n=1 Tax=Apolygus lucorum TaxID=248454 RepID=A0A8S9Y1D5_APOLU|nr:hypothetical protein GE061_008885 [Apolygus lucorum]